MGGIDVGVVVGLTLVHIAACCVLHLSDVLVLLGKVGQLCIRVGKRR